MSNFRNSGPSGTNSTQDGKKKRKPKDFGEQIGEIRNTKLSEQLEKRKAEADALRRAEEDEVARMTYGPSYRREE